MHPPLPPLHELTVAVIGLGYVGLPLALEFAKPQTCIRTDIKLKRKVSGFDINEKRLSELRSGIDLTKEASANQLKCATELVFSSDTNDLALADVFIVTVPTPISKTNRPDLTPLEKASKTVGSALRSRLRRGKKSTPVVIYESTVFPGATEEICIPILEETSGLTLNEGFACGYSPERINPGDKHHGLTTITKVTSGSNEHIATWIDDFYGSIITAGTHKSPSIKVAEAAKVIENTQRDLNIALINELAIIFSKLKIDTLDVLDAAGSKWNFLPFRPGLVGGHCIGVDPYYLTHKAEEVGYHPEVVLAGRRINDRMGEWITSQVVLSLARKKVSVGDSTALILGITFKEDCPDLRNTRVIDIVRSLREYSIQSIVVDPWASRHDALSELGIDLCSLDAVPKDYEVLIVAVAHDAFRDMSIEQWRRLGEGKVIFDVKGIVPRELSPIRL